MKPAFFRNLVLALVPLAALMGAAAPALAQSGGVLPLDRILPEIRRSHPGQFFDADGPSEDIDGSQHYHLKWMTPDGRIEWLDVEARTGRVLSASPGRDTFDRPGTRPDYPSTPSYPVPQPQRRFRNDDGPVYQGGYSRDRRPEYGNGPQDRGRESGDHRHGH